MNVDDLIDAQDSPAAEFEVNTDVAKVADVNKDTEKENAEIVKAEDDQVDEKLTEVGAVTGEGDLNITETIEVEDVANNVEGEPQNKETAENQDGEQTEGEKVETEHVGEEQVEGRKEGYADEAKKVEGELDSEQVTEDKTEEKDEEVIGEQAEIDEHLEGEHAESELPVSEQTKGDHAEGEHTEGEHTEGEQAEHEQIEGEHIEGEQIKHDEIDGEHVEGEGLVGEEIAMDEEPLQPEQEQLGEELLEEGDEYYEPPVDPAAPYNLTDSKEELRPPFHLRPDQEAELESLWELYQDYTPAYSDLDNYITEKELIYMLKCVNCMTHTPEQLQELIVFCVRPPHPKGHINFEQFKHIVKVRLRDISAEEELRFALQVMDPESTGILDRENLKEVLATKGHKMGSRNIDNLIKEVDIAQDGTIGIEDVVGTMAIDLNTEDLEILRAAVYPPDVIIGGRSDTEAQEPQSD